MKPKARETAAFCTSGWLVIVLVKGEVVEENETKEKRMKEGKRNDAAKGDLHVEIYEWRSKEKQIK